MSNRNPIECVGRSSGVMGLYYHKEVRELESYTSKLENRLSEMESCKSCYYSEVHRGLSFSSYCENCENREDPPEYWSQSPVNNYKYFKEREL